MIIIAAALFGVAASAGSASADTGSTPTATTVTATPTPVPQELKTTTVEVEVHAFVGSQVDILGNLVEDGRYDGYFAVILDDGTELIPWFQTNGLYNASVEIPAGRTAMMHWDDQMNGSEEPYTIDPKLCTAKGNRATTTDYRDRHYNIPELPRDLGHRSVEAFCGAVKVPVTTTAPPSTTTPTTTPEGSSTTVTTTTQPPAPTTPSTNPPTITVSTCGPTSPYWNAETGSCQLPFTGLNTTVATILPWVFVAIVVGIVLAIHGALASRRPTTVRVN